MRHVRERACSSSGGRCLLTCPPFLLGRAFYHSQDVCGLHRRARHSVGYVRHTEHVGSAGLLVTSSRESTSSSSASTAAARTVGGSCSTDCSSLRSITIRCATNSSSPIPRRRRCRPCPHRGGVIRPPSTGPQPIAHGEERDLGKSGQMNTPYRTTRRRGAMTTSAEPPISTSRPGQGVSLKPAQIGSIAGVLTSKRHTARVEAAVLDQSSVRPRRARLSRTARCRAVRRRR